MFSHQDASYVGHWLQGIFVVKHSKYIQMNTNYAISTFFDSRVVDPVTKESRVMVCISLQGKKFSYAIKRLRCTKSDYDKSYSNKSLSEVQKEIKSVINTGVEKAEGILKRLGKEATKEQFLKLNKSNINLSNSDKTDAYAIFNEQILTCKKENRFGSGANIYNALNSFKKFKSKFYLEDVSEQWIKDYKKWMIDNGRSVSTAGIFLRVLRSIIQQCMKDKVIIIEKNPFEGISVGWTVKSSKDILYPEHLKALWEYQPTTITETRAKDFFFLCYLSNGMNFKDVSMLRNKDLKNDRFVFIRSKTSTTQINTKEITVYLCDEVKRIIETYRTKSPKPDAFLFDIFNCRDAKHHNATFIRYKRKTNKELTKISSTLKINRAYLGIARHSFATKLKIDGYASAHISEYLGHSNERTTSNYLKSLPSEIHSQMNSQLLNF